MSLTPCPDISFISIRHVEDWVPRRHAEIFDAAGTLWDSPIEAERVELSEQEVVDMPLIDDNHREINVYTARGTRIARRLALLDPTVQPYAGLVTLRHIHELFRDLPTDVSDTDSDDGIRRPQKKLLYHVYPQAGLKYHGHFQAEGLINKFKPFMKELNAKLQDKPRSNSLFGDDDSDDGGDTPHSPHAPITGKFTQGYNSLSHYTRGKGAQHHDAQLGLITAALAGSYAKTPKEVRTAQAKYDLCRHDLPHQRFAHKIAEADVNRELRLENVYNIDLLAMKPECRTGG